MGDLVKFCHIPKKWKETHIKTAKNLLMQNVSTRWNIQFCTGRVQVFTADWTYVMWHFLYTLK